MIFLTRKAEFSSAHYYWNEAWTPEENQRVFGKCANRNGHGHNYTLEVTVAGEIDPTSGFVVDLKELKDILEHEVVSIYDHRHLNLEVPEFMATQHATAIPTTENIAIAIWQRLNGKIPNARLHRVRVYEMPDLFADFYGEK
jgi:6-pyruvoyltetrahydropterin/6-carboxytetrahydropterin synthase